MVLVVVVAMFEGVLWRVPGCLKELQDSWLFVVLVLFVEQAGNIPAGNVCPMASFASVPRSTWSVLSVGFGRIDVEVAAVIMRFHHCTEHRFWLELPPFKHATLAHAFQTSDDFCRSVPRIVSQSKSICILKFQKICICIYVYIYICIFINYIHLRYIYFNEIYTCFL